MHTVSARKMIHRARLGTDFPKKSYQIGSKMLKLRSVLTSPLLNIFLQGKKFKITYIFLPKIMIFKNPRQHFSETLRYSSTYSVYENTSSFYDMYDTMFNFLTSFIRNFKWCCKELLKNF